MDEKQLIAKLAKTPDMMPTGHAKWQQHCYSLRRHAVSLGDPVSDFLNWSTIQGTMFVGEAPYVKQEYDALVAEWPECLGAIEEGQTGSPPRLSFEPSTSGNMVHQAYHLLQLRRQGVDITEMKSIVEFGGGYGALARLCYRLGFRGEYVIYDLQHFSWLQQYYLEQEGVPFTPVYYGTWETIPEKPDLVVACYSMSETTVNERMMFMRYVKPKKVLIAYADVYGGFKPKTEIPDMLDGLGYNYVTSGANPPGTNYAIGWRKE